MVFLVFQDRERPWTPREYLDESPKWWDAFHYCLPYVMDEYEAMVDRRRKEQESAAQWRRLPSK